MTTKIFSASALLILGSAGLLPVARAAEPSSPAATTSTAPASTATPLDQRTLDKRINPIFKSLALNDAAKEARVRAVLEPHFQALQSWHAKNDADIAMLWTQWSAARTPPQQDEAKAAAVVERINQVYASFQPEHDAFLTSLTALLTPTQVEAVKDVLTRSPGLKRTYDAYLQIIPELTAAQKEFALQKLRVARERAMDAITDKEKANIFKTQKIQIEAYFNAQGYDWKRSYAAFVAKLNAEAAAAKAAKKD